MTRADIRFNQAVIRAQKRLGAAEWRPPLHGCHVLVNAEGRVAAQVRELGMRRPKRDRRYAAKIDGVEWWTANVLSPEPRYLPLRGFTSAKEAMAVIDEARAIILAEDAA